MPQNKKHHFVPKFYLKNFSLNNDRKTIGVFNISTSKYIALGSLKNQAYRNYFYGRNSVIEKSLADIEGRASDIIRSILNNNCIPQLHSGEHYALLTFIILQQARTVYHAEMINELSDKLLKSVLSKDSECPPGLNDGNFSMKNPTYTAIENAILFQPLTSDLKYKLIINHTQIPFIASDHPVVLYNQFLESRKKFGSNTGYACKGLEIFLPISPNHLLIFFDKDTYQVGTRNKNTVILTIEKEIHSLNMLQVELKASIRRLMRSRNFPNRIINNTTIIASAMTRAILSNNLLRLYFTR